MMNWDRDRALIERAARWISLGLVTIISGLSAYYGYAHFWGAALVTLGTVRGSLFFGLLGAFYLSVLIVSQSGNLLTRLLEISVLRYLGRISYGLYLYHFPLYRLVETFELQSVRHDLPQGLQYDLARWPVV